MGHLGRMLASPEAFREGVCLASYIFLEKPWLLFQAHIAFRVVFLWPSKQLGWVAWVAMVDRFHCWSWLSRMPR